MQKQTAITTETVIVTPEMALEWYGLSGGNRPIRKNHVEFLVEQMKNDWKLNGEAIIFDSDGKLIEGHHRLVACAESGVPFETLVVRGVSPDAKATINTGCSRNQGDALSFEFKDISSNSTVSTTLVRLIEWERGRLSSPTAQKISNTEVVEAFRANPGIETAVRAAKACKNVIAPSRIAWLFYILHKRHKAMCEEFFARLADGANLGTEHPVYLLRQRLLNARGAGRGSAAMPLNEGLAILVKAWNAFLRKRDLKQLRWSSRTEDFPKVEGV